MSNMISLRDFDYKMSNDVASRQVALNKAIAKHGHVAVIKRLQYLKINEKFADQTDSDIQFVENKYAYDEALSPKTEYTDDDESVHDESVHDNDIINARMQGFGILSKISLKIQEAIATNDLDALSYNHEILSYIIDTLKKM